MSTNWNTLRITSATVSLLLLHSSLIVAQQPTQDRPGMGELSITIIDGDNAIMNPRQRVNREAIVQVEDENHKPVAGALVTFLAPNNGPTATFSNGAHSITLTTDAQGRAVLQGITPNKASGKFQIKVTASKQGRTATTTMTQTNAVAAGAGAAAGGISAKLLIGLLIAGGVAAGVGIAVANSGGKSTTSNPTPTPTPPIVLTPGTPGVGAPR